jgi:glycosyltransferase involved in cell wall biosynthesis
VFDRQLSTPTLALCVPAFNAAAFLPRLMESVRQQTVPFHEVLIYDDCSTDDTAQLARELGAQVVSGDINRGCAFGRNALAQKSSCDWVHFHDADDAFYPNFVEQAQKWMVRNDAPDAVLFGYDWIDDESKERLDTVSYDHTALSSDPIRYSIRQQIQSICGIYRREKFLVAGGYDLDPKVLYNEDVAMHTRLARWGFTFAADSTVTVINYRQAQSMSSGNQVKCIRAHCQVLKKSAAALDGKYADELARKLWLAAGVAATYLDWETADSAAALATRLQGRVPANGGFLFKLLCSLSPRLALRTREYLIRVFKPRYRQNVPRYTGAS